MGNEAHEDKNKRGYHHGDLRRHLLQVAHEEISLHGAQHVSLSSLSRLAGVSQPAPYRHFSDREALLEAVATEAFETFTDQLRDAVAGHTPQAALEALSLVYLRYGEANIELYRLMFASRLIPTARDGSTLDQASNTALSVLWQTLADLATTSDRAALENEVYRIWAQLHGLVMLKADGFITRPLTSYLGGSGK